MRPYQGYGQQGDDAWFDGKDENANPCPDGTLGHLEWLGGYLAAKTNSTDLDEDQIDEAHVYLSDVTSWKRQALHALGTALPTCTDVGDAIGLPVSKWKSNCFHVAVQALESGVLDDFQARHGSVFPVYGMYLGPFAPGGFFGDRRFARHGWLESADGHVIDPTRWVFTDTYPSLWVGALDDYDLGGTRFRASVAPRSKPETGGVKIQMGINDPQSLLAFDRMLGTTREIVKTGAITAAQMRWIVNSPLEVMGPDAELFLSTADRLGLKALVPVDTRLWVEFSRNGYDPAKLRTVTGYQDSAAPLSQAASAP